MLWTDAAGQTYTCSQAADTHTHVPKLHTDMPTSPSPDRPTHGAYWCTLQQTDMQHIVAPGVQLMHPFTWHHRGLAQAVLTKHRLLCILFAQHQTMSPVPDLMCIDVLQVQ